YRRGHGRDAAGTDERRESFDSRENAKNPETVRGLGDGAYFYVKGTAEVGVQTGEPERQLALPGLEELDRVPRRGVEDDLLAAGAGDDLVAEAETGVTQPVHLGGDVVHDELDAVPAPGLGATAIGHGPSRGARGPAEQEAEVAPGDVGERRGRAREEREAQVIGVEGDGFVDVVDHVPDVDGAHGFSFRRETETRKSISR